MANATWDLGTVATFAYDALNRRTWATYANGAVATFAHDAASRTGTSCTPSFRNIVSSVEWVAFGGQHA